MVRIFANNLRLMAELLQASPAGTDKAAIVKVRKQRGLAYRYFGDVNAQSDAVPFETGTKRVADMAARDRIRRWQSLLRTFYLLEAPLIQFRIFRDVEQKSRPFAVLDDTLREEARQALEYMAESLESQLSGKPYDRSPRPSLRALLQTSEADVQSTFSDREETLLRMLKHHRILVGPHAGRGCTRAALCDKRVIRRHAMRSPHV